MATFLHIADLHIDREFSAPERVLEHLREFNARVLENIVEEAIAREVDVVIFAGDTFHHARSSIHVQSIFFKELGKLKDNEIPVVLTFGNHDYYEENKFWYPFDENTHVIKSENVETVEIITRNNEKIHISGFSYTSPKIEQSKVAEFPPREISATLQIGIYHGEEANVGNYAPFSMTEMKQKNYDYWALGHIHLPEVLSMEPLIAYPGTPQGHNKKENGNGGVIFGFQKEGRLLLETIDVSMMKYRNITIDLSDIATMSEVNALLEEKLSEENTLFSVIMVNTEHLGEEFARSVSSGELERFLKTNYWVNEFVVKKEVNKQIPLQIREDEFLEIFSETDVLRSMKDLELQLPNEILREIDADFTDEVKKNLVDELMSLFSFEKEVFNS